MVKFEELSSEALVNSAQLRLLVCASSMSIWRWQRDYGFPAPIQISGRNYWRLGSIREWLSQREAESASTKGGA